MIRKTVCGVALATALIAADLTARAEPVTLTLPQAEALAQQSLSQGQPQLAYELSEGLLQANPESGQAHYLQALALADMKRLGPARRSAAKAYRFSQTDMQRFESSALSAKLSFADDRLTGSQLWLRRAVQYAPNEATRDRTIKDYQIVRYRNPLNFNFSFSVTPSDNVNNGSTSPLNAINGVPDTGTLSTGAQALSGVIATASLDASYRVHEAQNHETRVTGALSTRQVDLSDSAPDVSSDDLSSSTAELGLRHLRRGTSNKVNWRFDIAGGRSWYGGEPIYDFARVGVVRSQRLTERLSLSLGASVEEQHEDRSKADNTHIRLTGGLGYKLGENSQVALRVLYRNADSDRPNRSSEQWAAIASYRPERQLGPATLDFSLGYSSLDYSRYLSPFRGGFFSVPGGRVDESTFGTARATFNDWGYMGFVPTISVTAEKSRSNISRFEVEETSLSLGIRSEF